MSRARARRAVSLLAAASIAGSALAQEAEPSRTERTREYAILVEARLAPSERAAHVSLQLGDGASLVRLLDFQIDPRRHVDFQGDGSVEPAENGQRIVWKPPPDGGALRYVFRIDHLRDERSYDARCTSSWALFRGDDLVPAARVRTRAGARSRSYLRLRLPEGWSTAVPYPRLTDGRYRIEHPHRSFDRPVGWMVVGELGVVREDVAGTRVVLAGPRRQGVRRYDMLALLRWTLPSLRALLDELPPRLLVASAGDPMWRGGLSAPRSVYLHASRPLITDDGTSPLLHELLHAALGQRAAADGDWIVEGLAEHYSLELLRRSGTVSPERAASSLARHAERGAESPLGVGRANGRVASRAVTVLQALDAHLQKESGGERDLDAVVRVLAAEPGTLTSARFRDVVERATGVDIAPFLSRYGVAVPDAQ